MAAQLANVIAALESIAPLDLAEEWDNVGLLVAPSEPRPITAVFLTIDLRPAVLDEALAAGAELIVAYHPPLFEPLRRLRPWIPAERIALRCAESRIAVWSPHTALDAVAGGVNDWLAEALGVAEREVIVPRGTARVTTEGEPASAKAGRPGPSAGQGRRVKLSRPVTLSTLLRRIKSHLGIERLRVARAPEHAGGARVLTIALCAGAGGSVLAGAQADVYWTGEMRHHDVLAANGRGTTVILCEHTNTERGYLAVLHRRIASALGRDVEIFVSRVDRDPLEIV